MPATQVPDYAAIGKAIVDQLGAQAGLATTLATALSGGLIALVIQVAIHNRSAGNTAVALTWTWLIVVALLLEGASLLLGYAARGAITDTAPILMQLPGTAWTGAAGQPMPRFAQVAFPGAGQLRWLIGGQFLAMFLGLAAMGGFAWRNLRNLV